MDPKKLNGILFFLILVLGSTLLYFISQSSEKDKKIEQVLSICGDRCTEAFVEFKINGLGEALDAVEAPKKEIKECLDSNSKTEIVNKQFNTAAELGFTGTPATVIFNRDTKLGVKLPGAVPGDFLKVLVEEFTANEHSAGDVLYEFEEQGMQITVEDYSNMPEVTEADNYKGNLESNIALVEYSDFDCPYCATFHTTMEQLMQENGQLLWVFRHFPLRAIHPEAQKKAEASECVADIMGSDKFWDFAHALYAPLQTQ